MSELQKMGPLNADHPLVDEHECPACNYAFEEGDFVTLVSIGPGRDHDARQRAREGRPYTSVAISVHYACATGKEPN